VATTLFLGASISQLPAIRAARADGHRVLVVDADRHAIGFAEADAFAAVDFSDVPAVADFARSERVDAVLAVCSDRAVLPAALIAERLGLPGIGSDVARRMTDKSAMRACLAAAGVRQPPYALVGDDAQLEAAVEEVGLPAVLKPVDSGGQRGLFLVESADEARRRLPEVLEVSRCRKALVERFVEGTEVNTLVVVRGGEPTLVVASDRLRPSGLGFGVGWAHRYPSTLPEATRERVRETAFAAVGALGLRDGIAFPQLLADAGGDVHVVEVAARIGAGQMADLARLATGVDLYRVAFRFGLGTVVPAELVEPRFDRPTAIRFFTAAPGPLPTGKVVAVDGLDAVLAADGVLEAGLYLSIGETIRPVQVDADRRGYVVAAGRDGDDALARADAAATRLRVTTEAVAVG
jgi:biotin carboxylase